MYARLKLRLKQKMQPKLKDFRYIEGMDVAQYFELNAEEARLEAVLKYSKGLVINAQEYGVNKPVRQRVATPRNTTVIQPTVRVHTPSSANGSRNWAGRVNNDLHQNEQHATLTNLLEISLNNLRQVTASLSSLNDSRNEHRDQ